MNTPISNKQSVIQGHLFAIITIIIWGTTFISTKILLRSFQPIEILFFRFLIGYFALWLIYPKLLAFESLRKELLYAAAGFCGITLYFLLENIALTYSTASNIGVIVSLSPFFTALLAQFFIKGEHINPTFLLGFLCSISGVALMSFSSNQTLHVNPLGDVLAVLATIIWAVYSILTSKIHLYGNNTIGTTRRTFFYGLLFMLPIFYFQTASTNFFDLLAPINQPVNLFNILFLGLGASATCFVSWNIAVKKLGAIKTSVYIYLVPVITVITSIIILHEALNWMSALGILLVLSGLFVSQKR